MGGSCSKSCASAVAPTITSFNPISPTTNVSIVPKSTRFIENCIVIWLFDDPSKKFETEKEQLRRHVYELKAFTNPETCIDYIKDIHDEKIFLIISVTYQSIVYFSHLSQIEKIYIFDSSSQQSLSQNIFSNIHQLCKQLEEDMELCEFDLMKFSVISNSLLSSKEEVSFIFTQIINEIMVRLKFESGAKDVWIEFCRRHYANHLEQLHIIDQFAKYYRPNTALDWLRKSCFISKILNRMKRTCEIDVLYKLGFFIKHVNMQLLRLHEKNTLATKNISVVYRGKTMLKDEFDLLLKDNVNGLMSFSNFLITTMKKNDTIDFVRRRLVIHPDLIAIIFEIYVDYTIFNEESPFALIKVNGMNTDEICFTAGTVFRIKSIEQLIDNSLIIWLIKLNLIGKDDPQLVSLLKPFRTNEIHENPLSCLGKLLIDMGEYRRAEQFFLEMLNDASVQSQPRRLVRVQNGLATNYMYKGEYGTALEYYKKALEISLIYLPPDHADLAFMYKYMGDCYFKQNNYNHALQNYERGIYLIENNLQSSKYEILTELHSLISKTKALIENNQ
jgi:tetratricopeptide (TPR) repeat protein